MISAFFRLTKVTLIAFILFYIFFTIIIALATGGFLLRDCPSCPSRIMETLGFYALSLAFSYILFCWVNHVWGKVLKIGERT